MDSPKEAEDKCKGKTMNEIRAGFPHLVQAAEDAKKMPKPLPEDFVDIPIGFQPRPVVKA